MTAAPLALNRFTGGAVPKRQVMKIASRSRRLQGAQCFLAVVRFIVALFTDFRARFFPLIAFGLAWRG